MEFSSPRVARTVGYMQALFVAAAVWNLAGGVLGYVRPETAFELLFARPLDDPLFYGIYRGATGTTLLYFVGYSIVALNPLRHTGIVIVGGLGKVGFAVQLSKFYLSDLATSNALIVIIGDMVFFALFLVYFWTVRRMDGTVIGRPRLLPTSVRAAFQ